MPNRFISGMSSLPRGESPPQTLGGASKMPAESAKALAQEWVRVMSWERGEMSGRRRRQRLNRRERERKYG